MIKPKFREFKGYRFNKRIFQLTTIIIIIFLVSVIVINGFTPKYYYACEIEGGCELDNIKPFCKVPNALEEFKYPARYDWLVSCGLCSYERVLNGFTCGEKTGLFQGLEGFISFVLVLLAFLINHFRYNKKFNIEEMK